MREIVAGASCRHRPLIAIAPSHDGDRPSVSQRYLNAVWLAGGLPVVLPYIVEPERMAEYAVLFDGFLFSGGVDVDPALYGEEKQFDSVEIDPERDAFEKALFEAVYPTKKPIFGICRGIQSINVWMGGTLCQHIDGHRQSEAGTCRGQTLAVVEGSLLHELCGKREIKVNSFHHQVVKTVASGLVVDAISAEEGYIEAMHAPDHPFLFLVQFHPEFYSACEDDDHSGRIFDAFVQACL